MASRFGIDVGGTFTDLLYFDAETGEFRVGKVDTTIDAPERGVVEAAQAVIDPPELAATEYFLHGTTVGLNSLLTRTGAKVGLLCTSGFRDQLEIRRGDRTQPWRLICVEPEPLVPRRLVCPVGGRMLFDGSEHETLAEGDVHAAAAVFAAEGVDSVAVAFLHSYANPAHELRAAEVLREAGFEGEISLSHEVTGVYREYERTSTTVIDAYVRPRMSGYLGALDKGLRESGFTGMMTLMRSGGGAFTFDQAEQRPFETIMSGPVAGAEGAAEIAREHGLGDLITADVGGTSFDTALITEGRPQLVHEGMIEGMVVQSPWVDVRSIGAGGGSIAWVDRGGLLQVGPQSAGSTPGPAGYGRGGTEPTVTDAAFVLGMLGPGQLAGGRRSLDLELSRAAFEPLAEQLGMEIDEVAQGVLRIAAAHMAMAIREITVEQGIDPRDCTLMPFGGAGPLFGTLLAEELQIQKLAVPQYAGNLSAWGLLGADLTQVASRTSILPEGEGTVAAVNEVLRDLFATIAERMAGVEMAASEREVNLDIRYAGQEHTISIPVPSEEDGTLTLDVEELRRLFVRGYERTFAHTMEEAMEIESVRATVRVPLPHRGDAANPAAAVMDGTQTAVAHSFSRGERTEFQVVDRASIADSLAGPAIVIEQTATTYLDAGFRARVIGGGHLLIERSV